jgi:hypothetical protein
MHFRFKRFGLLRVIGLAAILQCRVPASDANEIPAGLLVYPRATAVSYNSDATSKRVAYHVEIKFPGSGVIGWISYTLQNEGWQPLPYDFSNPQLPSSNVTGWVEQLYGPKVPGNCAHVWMGDWSNASGDIVHYDFRYKQGKNCTVDATHLDVNAFYVPATVAQESRKLLQEHIRNQP